MTKEEARKHLEDWANKQIAYYGYCKFPICDEVVFTKISWDTADKDTFSNSGENLMEQWTFQGLIKIAYDL